jgi:hypothetical protein
VQLMDDVMWTHHKRTERMKYNTLLALVIFSSSVMLYLFYFSFAISP